MRTSLNVKQVCLNEILTELSLRNFSHWKYCMLQHKAFCISPLSSCKFEVFFWLYIYIYHQVPQLSPICLLIKTLLAVCSPTTVKSELSNLSLLSMHGLRTRQPLNCLKQKPNRCSAPIAWVFREHNSIWGGDSQLTGNRMDGTEQSIKYRYKLTSYACTANKANKNEQTKHKIPYNNHTNKIFFSTDIDQYLFSYLSEMGEKKLNRENIKNSLSINSGHS